MKYRRYRWKSLYRWADNIIMNQLHLYASDIDLFTSYSFPKSEWLVATWEITFALIKYCKLKNYDMKIGLYAEIVVHKNYRLQGLNHIKAFKYSKHRPPNIVLYKVTEKIIDYESSVYLEDISSILGIKAWLNHSPGDYTNVFTIYFENIYLNKKQKQRLQEMGNFIDFR